VCKCGAEWRSRTEEKKTMVASTWKCDGSDEDDVERSFLWCIMHPLQVFELKNKAYSI